MRPANLGEIPFSKAFKIIFSGTGVNSLSPIEIEVVIPPCPSTRIFKDSRPEDGLSAVGLVTPKISY